MATKKATAKAVSGEEAWRGRGEAVPNLPTGEDAPISNGHDTETQRASPGARWSRGPVRAQRRP